MLTLGGRPAAARIAEIAALDADVARNRAITETYHELAISVRDTLGGSTTTANASWCAFAVWASNTAGQSIALDRVPGRVDELLRGSGDYREARAALGGAVDHSEVIKIVDATCDQVSADISAGNLLVFTELAPAYVALVDGTPPPADEPATVSEAMASYRTAAAASAPAEAAQFVLLANLVAVLHEQERLQPAIGAALDAGVGETARTVAHGRLEEAARRVLGHHLATLEREVDAAWDRALTEHVMTMRLPDEVLHLGHDVPPLPDGARFPADLATVTAPELTTFLETYDRTGGTGVGSAARDWAQLADRMNYITTLFRSRQQHPPLFENPFPPAPG